MYSVWKRDPLTVDDKALSRRAFLLGAVAIAGATILPAPSKAVAGASISSGILRTGLMQGGACQPTSSAGALLKLKWWLQDLEGSANTWLQSWVKDAVGKETYSLFESWFSGKETTL